MCLLVLGQAGIASAQLPGGSLDPTTIPKYVEPLAVIDVMPKTSATPQRDYYEIGVRQFQQQILPPGFPKTRVWGYGSVNHPGTFAYPARTIEATVDKPVRVKWINQLVVDPEACAAISNPTQRARARACNYLPHLLPVDQTLHWANPGQLPCMQPDARPSERRKTTDCRPDPMHPDNAGVLQRPYRGPVPTVVHLHGAHVEPHSDGYPEAWWLPAANDIPGEYARRGSHYTQAPGAAAELGAAVYEYRNDQRATALWFHDHSLGMTRTNVYAGPTGFYLLRGGTSDLRPGRLPRGKYEIPLIIQDKSFNADGSLFYPNTREFFDGFAGPYTGDPLYRSDVAPLHNPEFFGNTMVVNGKTWPFLQVEPRKYRFRILNASDSRFLILKLGGDDPERSASFTVIGTDGGFLPAPVTVTELLVGPAERFDVIVDFAGLPQGTRFRMRNIGPDSPFGGPFPRSERADRGTTGQVMQFRVVAARGEIEEEELPTLPTFTPVPDKTTVRKISLNELESELVCVDENNVFAGPVPCTGSAVPAGPTSARLGTIDAAGLGVPLMWESPVTENPKLGAVEEWEISNFTADAHPIHIHMVMFQVIDRQAFDAAVPRSPETWESGYKDTVVAYPGEITRVRAVYDIAGLFVWHCHILSHEDNEMMRPYFVGDPASSPVPVESLTAQMP
jgi:FtsP/CotA-like multicopper oxidase with cupredoxin domain